jgi:GTP-binding protein EngB required for normal cell division
MTPPPKEYRHCKLTPERVCNFFYQQPDKFKSYMLGINSHLQNSINQGVMDLNELWFANYLKPNPSEDDDMARIDVFIKVIQQTEILDQEFINSKMYEYKLNTGGLATHLVEEVVYGAEFICSMQRKVNQQETKESAEENLYRESKIYFDEIMSSNPMFTTRPAVKLGKEVYCKIFSSLSKADEVIEGNFLRSISWLSNKVTNINKEKLVPVEILLRYIPEQIETRLRSERMNDLRTDIDWHRKWIDKESSRILKIATLDRVFPLAKVVCQFHGLLTPVWNEIEKFYGNIVLGTVSPSDQELTEFQLIKKLLRDMKDWLTQRPNEIKDICSLLDGKQLVALDLEHIRTSTTNNDEQLVKVQVKVLVLKVDHNENPVVDYIMQKVVDLQTKVLKLPVFSLITKLQEKLVDEVRNKLNKFANEADLNGCQNRSPSYYTALVSNSSLDDGTIRNFYFDKASNTISFGLVSVDDPINSLEKPQQQNPPDGFNLINSMLPQTPMTPTVGPPLNQQQIQIENCGPFSATASSVTTNTTFGDHENQKRMNTDGSSAYSSDSETTDDGSNMVQFLAATKTHPSMQQEHSDKTEIQSNAAAISRNAEAGQDLIVREIEEMKIDDVAEETPSRPASTAADVIQKSSAAAAGKQKVKQRSDSNDRERHAGQSDPKHDRFESGSQSNLERHDKNGFDSSRQEEDGTTQDQDQDETKQVWIYDERKNQMPQNEEFPSNRRIAEIFSDTSEQFCTLIKKGRPNVYLLNAEEKSTSEDFRWFDIGRSNNFTLPSKNHRNHKVIILMGATGCGKSTLINGMVNYILGVQWNDPFRFKCVREDETTAKNQAHSQTSTVTAYTIRHHDGMAVPYSITIIDTPGYGDTRGMDRDRLITRNIHQFLTQQENSVDQIHAACFVAASGDSRLTATQRYIIDSVLSIFGKDVKENMRLLVTFADNAHPPVVEACLAANFPVTSASAGISYSKFNSSVLYANNEQQGDDDFCVDGLFWDMVQVNFTKFFTMLENMNGKDLKSTRNVIQTRGLLEQSLNDIEQELEVCFVKIENIEMFQRLREYGQRMESDKNVIFEKTEMRPTKFTCPKEFFAYNCHRCRNTCERPIKLKYSERQQNRKCDKEFCTCPASEHEYQQFEWRLTPVKIPTTLKDMKAEYESNYDRKVSVEQLLADNLEELNLAKAEVLRLLEQVGISAQSLESTALRSNALTPSDYLSLMKSRVSEEQAPGYQTRLETLTELQNCLAADASASASHKTASNIPNQTQHRSSNIGGASHRGNWGSKTSQHGNADDYWLANTTTAGASNYSSGYNTRAASGSGLNQSDINQSAVTRRGTAENANQKLKHGSDSSTWFRRVLFR